MTTAVVNGNAFVRLHECGMHHDTRLGCPALRGLPDQFTVDVTIPDIIYGKPCVADQCAISLAVKRWLYEHQVPFITVTVTGRDIDVIQDWDRPAVEFTHDAAEFTAAFDALEPVAPQLVHLRRVS